MRRRFFLQHALAAPAFISAWNSGPPAAYVERLTLIMRVAGVPGAVIGALRGFELAWIAPVGVKESGTDRKVGSATLFHAASLTKQVTAHAALSLHDQQKLDLDRPLSTWVDDLPSPAAKTVTARHVLSHSSGFRNWRFAESGAPVPDFVPALPLARGTATPARAISSCNGHSNRSPDKASASFCRAWYSSQCG